MWYAIYGCGCIYEVPEKNPISPKFCPRHNTAVRVTHESEEWAKKTPEYQKNRNKANRHYPWDEP